MSTRQRKPAEPTANGHVSSQTPPQSSSSSKNPHGLLTWDDLPPWQRDNQFIRTNYRPASNSILRSLHSLSYLHNESVNIYTHLLPSLLVFSLLLLTPYLSPSTQSHLLHYFVPTAIGTDTFFFGFFFAGFITCLFVSSMYHTCSNHSHTVASNGNKADYVGIVLLITGSFIPSIYYGFLPDPRLAVVYWGMISSLAVACIVVSVTPKFRTPAYRPIRAGMFVGMGLSAVFPVLHGLWLYGIAQMDRQIGLRWLVAQGALYILGAGIYAARMPEKLRPGGFDVWGSSHQIFHILVVVAGVCHFVGLIRAAEYSHLAGK